MKNKNIYALYKGDTFIDLGTLDELARSINVSRNTMMFYTSKVHQKRKKNPNKGYIVIKIEDN